MNLPEFLIRQEADEIRIAGHRIGLYHVVQYYNDGYSAEMLACQYPTLPLALIHKIIAFYLENKPDVDAYMATCQDELRQQKSANPHPLPLAKLRERLEAVQAAEPS